MSASSRGASVGGTTTVRPPWPASSHSGVPRRAPPSTSPSSRKRTTAPCRSSPRSNTCTWPRPITVTVCGRTGTVAPSIECCPRPVADPDQLVVVVPVRLARGGAAEARPVQPHHLHRAAVEAVEGELAHAAPQSARSRRWRQRKAASNTSACSPPAAAAAGRSATSSTHARAAARERLQGAVVVPRRAGAERRSLAEAAPGLDGLELQIVVVDRQHAAEQDPRAPERARPDHAVARRGHARERRQLGVDAVDRGGARPHLGGRGAQRGGHAEGMHVA